MATIVPKVPYQSEPQEDPENPFYGVAGSASQSAPQFNGVTGKISPNQPSLSPVFYGVTGKTSANIPKSPGQSGGPVDYNQTPGAPKIDPVTRMPVDASGKVIWGSSTPPTKKESTYSVVLDPKHLEGLPDMGSLGGGQKPQLDYTLGPLSDSATAYSKYRTQLGDQPAPAYLGLYEGLTKAGVPYAPNTAAYQRGWDVSTGEVPVGYGPNAGILKPRGLTYFDSDGEPHFWAYDYGAPTGAAKKAIDSGSFILDPNGFGDNHGDIFRYINTLENAGVKPADINGDAYYKLSPETQDYLAKVKQDFLSKWDDFYNTPVTAKSDTIPAKAQAMIDTAVTSGEITNAPQYDGYGNLIRANEADELLKAYKTYWDQRLVNDHLNIPTPSPTFLPKVDTKLLDFPNGAGRYGVESFWNEYNGSTPAPANLTNPQGGAPNGAAPGLAGQGTNKSGPIIRPTPTKVVTPTGSEGLDYDTLINSMDLSPNTKNWLGAKFSDLFNAWKGSNPTQSFVDWVKNYLSVSNWKQEYGPVTSESARFAPPAKELNYG